MMDQGIEFFLGEFTGTAGGDGKAADAGDLQEGSTIHSIYDSLGATRKVRLKDEHGWQK